MSQLTNELQRYLSEVTHHSVEIQEIPEARQTLPIFMGQQYEFFRCRIFDRIRTLLVWTGRQNPKIQNISKHLELARSAIDQSIVFVFPNMLAFQRQRLIQHQIPFIVPKRHIYLPEAIIDIRTVASTTIVEDESKSKQLSIPAQVMLLYYLQRDPGEDWNLGQWAQNLEYSAMTISRAYRDLVRFKLVEPEHVGRKVILRFDNNRRKLWKRSKGYLFSPVRKRTVVQPLKRRHVIAYFAGYSALSHYSQLSEGSSPEYAMSNADYMIAKNRGMIRERHFSDDEICTVEKWRYCPRILVKNSHTVDRLSLYLSVQHDPDERVQIALDEMIESIEW